MIFIDTNVAIALRDMHPATHDRIDAIREPLFISVMTRIELENGAQKEPAGTDARRRLLDRLLQDISVVFFEHADIRAYGDIVYDIGFIRGKTIDRLIAAQVLARDARLITTDTTDYRRINGLRLEVWPAIA